MHVNRAKAVDVGSLERDASDHEQRGGQGDEQQRREQGTSRALLKRHRARSAIRAEQRRERGLQVAARVEGVVKRVRRTVEQAAHSRRQVFRNLARASDRARASVDSERCNTV